MQVTTSPEHFDVLIVGAGLSGIGAGHHLQTKCPGKTYAILEGRDCIGGTWDLFRYPGVRSDSDMFTLGYSFRPWTEPKAIADGPRILNYVCETAVEDDIDTAGKRVVVIGSGATAVTLVPELAKTAEHVTMLQRSPTYVVARPAQDPVANKIRARLPTRLAYHVIRWRNVMWGMYFFQL